MLNQRVYNSKLNPSIWDESDNIRQDAAAHLLKIGQDFYQDVEIKASLKDVLMLGSSANYNWTPESDIDIHLVIDIKELGIPDEDASSNYLDALKSKWNSDHNITVKGHKVETYIQDVNHKTHATGIFSLLKNQWVVKPVKEKVNLDRNLIKKMFGEYVTKINKVTQSSSPEKLKALLDDIYQMRQKGLDSTGELSTENLVFKLIRSKGYLEKIRELKIRIYDKKVSLDESVNKSSIPKYLINAFDNDLSKEEYLRSINFNRGIFCTESTDIPDEWGNRFLIIFPKKESDVFKIGSQNEMAEYLLKKYPQLKNNSSIKKYLSNEEFGLTNRSDWQKLDYIFGKIIKKEGFKMIHYTTSDWYKDGEWVVIDQSVIENSYVIETREDLVKFIKHDGNKIIKSTKPKTEKVKDIWLDGKNIKTIPDELGVSEHSLYLHNSTIETLPQKIHIKGKLNLGSCRKLKSLPDNMFVGKTLNLGNCKSLKHLPKNLVVGEDLLLSTSSVSNLPTDLKVGGWLISVEGPLSDAYKQGKLNSLPPGVKNVAFTYDEYRKYLETNLL